MTFSPAAGATLTDATGNITLTFSEAVRKDAAGTALENGDLAAILTLKSTDADGGDIGFTATIDTAKTEITIDPSAALAEGAVYVAVTDGYYDAAGNQGSAAEATFTVDASVAAPVFSPAAGARVKDTSTDITLTFAEAIHKDASGGDFSTSELKAILTLKTDDENGGNIGFAATIDAAKKVVTVNPSAALAEGDVYVAISDGHYDAEGNQGAEASATFTVDATAPTVTFSPAAGATLTDATGNITLTFSEAVRKDAAGTALENGDLAAILTLKSTDADGGDIGFTATIDTAKTEITIDPSAALAEGAVYVAVTDGYYDAAGNQGSAAEATFTVDASVAAPVFSPAAGARVKDTSTDITLTFAEAIHKDASGGNFSTSELKAILTLKTDDENGTEHRLRGDHRRGEEGRHRQPVGGPGRGRRLRGDLGRPLRRRGQPGGRGERDVHGRRHRADGDVQPGGRGDADRRDGEHHADLLRGGPQGRGRHGAGERRPGRDPDAEEHRRGRRRHRLHGDDRHGEDGDHHRPVGGPGRGRGLRGGHGRLLRRGRQPGVGGGGHLHRGRERGGAGLQPGRRRAGEGHLDRHHADVRRGDPQGRGAAATSPPASSRPS